MDVHEWGWSRLLDKARELGPDADLAGVEDDELERRVRSGAAEIAALTCRWLGLLAEFVIRDGWAGFRSPGEWLSYAVGMGESTAREHVRVALRLRELPRIRAAFAAGRLSFSKVRAITRCAEPDLEPMLLEWADCSTAAQLERIVSSWRRTGRATPEQAHDQRSLWPVLIDDQTMEIRLRLPTADGEALLDRVDRLVELADRADDDDDTGTDDGADGDAAARLDPIDDADREGLVDGAPVGQAPPCRRGVPVGARRLDAVLDAVEQAAITGPVDTTGRDRHLLVLYAPADSLTSPGQQAASAEASPSTQPFVSDDAAPTVTPAPDRRVTVMTGRGRQLGMSSKVLRRLACDAAIRLVATDADGNPLDVGRKQRHATTAQRMALLLRDRHCRFPGCTSRRHLHVHHVIHWVDDGPTDLDNLVLVCSFHHRYVHDHDWIVQADPTRPGRFTFSAPGAAAPMPDVDRLPGASAETTRRRLVDDLGRPLTPDDLQPAHFPDPHYDLDMCVAAIQDQLDHHQPTARAA